MYNLILADGFLSTANSVIVLITGLFGLLSAGVGAFFAVKSFIKAAKDKSAKEIWALIVNMADAAMKQAEASQASGADKKKMVIEAVKAGCKAEGLDIDVFLDQLSAYIDQCIKFFNDMNKSANTAAATAQ